MTIQVEVSPEVEAQLAAEAEAQGVALEEVAGSLLEQMFIPRVPTSGKPTLQQFQAMLDALAVGSENLPKLKTESFTRESFYEYEDRS